MSTTKELESIRLLNIILVSDAVDKSEIAQDDTALKLAHYMNHDDFSAGFHWDDIDQKATPLDSYTNEYALVFVHADNLASVDGARVIAAFPELLRPFLRHEVTAFTDMTMVYCSKAVSLELLRRICSDVAPDYDNEPVVMGTPSIGEFSTEPDKIIDIHRNQETGKLTTVVTGNLTFFTNETPKPQDAAYDPTYGSSGAASFSA